MSLIRRRCLHVRKSWCIDELPVLTRISPFITPALPPEHPKALEKWLITEPTVLTMEDGSIETICGPRDHWLTLFVTMMHPENLTPRQAANLALIKRCIRSEEPGGAGMINVIRVMLADPIQTPNNQKIALPVASDTN